MNPCALYLRYSSDRQNERSPEDQEAVCRPYMERLGFVVAAVYVDRAKSGASVHERADFQRMLRDAKTGLFKAVCAETTSRYGRDEEDRAAARKRLTFCGVTIYTPVDGVVSRMMDGIKAVMDAQQLEDLKVMIHRGMSAVIRDGRHNGGMAYGYKPIPGKPGELEIVEEQAKIVRRIFREYIAGDTPRTIAARLNAEGIPPPRKFYWRASTINGHTKRRTGILQCELYVGRLIWNRAHRARDPDTGKRVWRHKPESEWQRNAAPHLRIIDDETFEAAQRNRSLRARATRRDRQRPKRLLSGLLRCGVCEAGMSKHDVDHGRPRIVCTRMIESRTCGNRRRYYLDEIERMVVRGLRAELGTREAVAYYARCYNEERRRATAEGANTKLELQGRLATIDRHIAQAVQAVIEDRITREEADVHLPGLRARRAELKALLATIEEPPAVISLQPAAVDSYLRDLERLEEVVIADLADGDEGAAKAIRNLVETVTIMPTERGRAPGIIVRGRLESLLGPGSFVEDPTVGGISGAG
jgi:DNA invertase Pin-like site-specific DNA recombinase